MTTKYLEADSPTFLAIAKAAKAGEIRILGVATSKDCLWRVTVEGEWPIPAKSEPGCLKSGTGEQIEPV